QRHARERERSGDGGAQGDPLPGARGFRRRYAESAAFANTPIAPDDGIGGAAACITVQQLRHPAGQPEFKNANCAARDGVRLHAVAGRNRHDLRMPGGVEPVLAGGGEARDTIAIESPTYYGILQIIEALGMKACEIPTFPREGVCLDELVKRLKCCRIKACMFSLNFSNPLGSCMPDVKKARLVKILAEREIPLIEDDLYGNLSHSPHRPKTAKAFDKYGLVLLCDSFTKTLAPGSRVGWTAPGR